MPSIRVDRNRVRVLRFPSRAYRRRRRWFCSNNCPCFFLLWERDRLRQTCRPRRGRDNVAWTLDKPRRICRYLQCVAGYNCDKARAFPWLHGDLQSKFNRQHDLVTATTGEGGRGEVGRPPGLWFAVEYQGNRLQCLQRSYRTLRADVICFCLSP